MRSLAITPRGRSLKVLCLGAHSDDIEIGCGGTVLTLIASHPGIEFDWVVLSAAGKRRKEAEAGAAAFLAGAARARVTVKDFRDGYFPYIGESLKDFFEELKKSVKPDLIFTPSSPRPPSGPPAGLRADLEHIPGPPHPGIRDPEIRRRPRGPERLRRFER